MQPGAAPKLADLRKVSDATLIARHDAISETVSIPQTFYLEELARRGAKAQGDRIEQLTESMARLTRVITWLTVVNTIAAIVAALVAVKLIG